MKLKLISKLKETNNVWSFQFEPPPKLNWKAGQSIRLEIPRQSYGYNERRFTISSLPSDNCLQITTRISDSEFKQDLIKQPIGGYINGYNIEGGIDWGDTARQKIFVAGGTGIALFYIILKDIEGTDLPANIHLLYSAKDSPMLFEKFFDQIKNDKFTFNKSKRRFTSEEILKITYEHQKFDIHISGPSNMVFGLQSELKSLGLPKDSVTSSFLL